MYQETNEKWKKHYVSYDKLYFKVGPILAPFFRTSIDR